MFSNTKENTLWEKASETTMDPAFIKSCDKKSKLCIQKLLRISQHNY